MTPSSTVSSLSFLLVFFLSFMALQLHHTFLYANASLIEDTCKAAAAINHNISYNFCVEAFTNNPLGNRVDVRGLAELAGVMSLKYVFDVDEDINNLTSKPQDPATKSCLLQCKENYSDVMANTEQAMGYMMNREDDGAVGLLEKAVEEAESCEEGFRKAGKPSPWATATLDYVQMATMSMVIIKLVTS